jgi:hypothetical protein
VVEGAQVGLVAGRDRAAMSLTGAAISVRACRSPRCRVNVANCSWNGTPEWAKALFLEGPAGLLIVYWSGAHEYW